MLKYVFAGDWVLEQMVGVQRYTFQILLALDTIMEQGNWNGKVELMIPENAKWDISFKQIQVVKKGRIKSKLEKHIWQQIQFPLYVRLNRAVGIDLSADLPMWGCDVLAVHDCIREAFPENFVDHKFYLKLYLFKVKSIIRAKNKQIVTLTNDSKREIQKYYKVPDNRISIVTCGWEHMENTDVDDTIFGKLNLKNDEEYFFSLGSKYKHKNFKWVIAAARKNPSYKFVITGTGAFSNNESQLQQNTPENVIFTGYISNEEIKSLMAHCKALIQPSLYEGFGLPPLEALSVGAPIIVSNTSCLPEIYKQAAHYIDPYADGCDLENLLREKVGNSADILKEYSWEHAAKQLIEVMNKFR
jgi:glycosyltransferase involved in cell wall biosynthesis